MWIFTKLRSGKNEKTGREGGANMWNHWIRDPKAIHWLLRDEGALQPDEVSLIEDWAAKQLEWGLHVRLHAGVSGAPQVVEVFGPDLVEPHVLSYRVGGEVQVDEAHGKSRRCASMTEALDFIVQHT